MFHLSLRAAFPGTAGVAARRAPRAGRSARVEQRPGSMHQASAEAKSPAKACEGNGPRRRTRSAHPGPHHPQHLVEVRYSKEAEARVLEVHDHVDREGE